MEAEDYYATLKLTPECSQEQIRKNFRQLALTCHPDRGHTTQHHKQAFLNLAKAKDILLDPRARKAFDNLLAARRERAKKHAEQDDTRRKLREDLELREERAKRQRANASAPQHSAAAVAEAEANARAALQLEIERLRRDGQLAPRGTGSFPDVTGAAAGAAAAVGASTAAATLVLRWDPNEAPQTAHSVRGMLRTLGAPAPAAAGCAVVVVGAKAVVELPANDAERVLQRIARGEATLRGLHASDSASSARDAGDSTHLPPGWKSATAPDGRAYFYHGPTRHRQWRRPVGEPALLAEDFERLEALALERLRGASQMQRAVYS